MCECANGHIKRSVNKKLSLGSATIGGKPLACVSSIRRPETCPQLLIMQSGLR